VVLEHVLNARDELLEAERLQRRRKGRASASPCRARELGEGDERAHLEGVDDVVREHRLLRVLLADLVGLGRDGEDKLCGCKERERRQLRQDEEEREEGRRGGGRTLAAVGDEVLDLLGRGEAFRQELCSVDAESARG